MKIHNIIPLTIFTVLSGSVIVLTTCKKSEDSTLSEVTTTTSYASFIGQKWATLNGTVNANNQINEVSFEYDTTETFGHSIIGTPDTVSGNTSTSVSAILTGLTPNTKYYFRIKAVSSSDTTRGAYMTFTTTNPGMSTIIFNPSLAYGSVIDIDSNVYKTILIGHQTWMAENLKAIRYNDSTAIPFIPKESDWSDLSTPGYCWYNNDSVVYGAIYNWHAISINNLCPAGWHVPTDAEWTTLMTFLGGENIAGGKIKETSITHWLTNNSGTTNETGFTALPGGYRNYSGTYSNIKRYGYWWSSTESSSVDAVCRSMLYSFTSVDRSNSSKKSGFSVRCLKD
jgi:uncharacterized protein (TIGR02145 family)